MAVGDVYEVTAKARVNGNDAMNVWYCRSTAEPATAEGIATNFADSALLEISLQCSSMLEYYEVIARNLFDPSDKWTEGVSIFGAVIGGGDSMPLHDAVGVQLAHDNPLIRSGSKRFAGLVEVQSDSFGILDPSWVAQFDGAMDELISNGVTEDVGEGLVQQIAEFVIVKSIPVIIEGVTGYRLPESAVEAVIGVITSAIVKPNITTQVSRKQGVGS